MAEPSLDRPKAKSLKPHFGMSERLGPVFHEHKTEHPFLGQRLAVEGATSDATVHAIEEETRMILSDAVEAAARTLTTHRSELDRLVDALLEHETLEQDDLERLLGVRTSSARELPLPSTPPLPPDPGE